MNKCGCILHGKNDVCYDNNNCVDCGECLNWKGYEERTTRCGECSYKLRKSMESWLLKDIRKYMKDQGYKQYSYRTKPQCIQMVRFELKDGYKNFVEQYPLNSVAPCCGKGWCDCD
jgi:hypothetical protein